jgi:hypothetical protein
MRTRSKPKLHSTGDLAYARIRDIAFDAVVELWRRRQREDPSLQQKDLAAKVGCSPARLNKALRGPANWTLRTFADLVDALDGEAEIKVYGLEDPPTQRSNYDAYAVYHGKSDSLASGAASNAGNKKALQQHDHSQGVAGNV